MALDQERKIEFYVEKINDLPSLPTVVMELTRIIDNPMSSVKEVEELMSQDQGLTLKVLKLANSAYYSIPGGAKTLLRAITFVGFSAVKQMVLTSTLFRMLGKAGGSNFDVKLFWKHSAGTGAVAELLARRLKLSSPEDVFVCGLVHDMGKIVLHMVEPGGFSELVAWAKVNRKSYEEAERALDFPRHGHWGQVLAKKWRLPVVIQCAVRDHHTARIGLRMSPVPEVNQVVDLVYIANRLTHMRGFGEPVGEATVNDDYEEVLKRCNLTEKEMLDLATEIDRALEKVSSLLDALNA